MLRDTVSRFRTGKKYRSPVLQPEGNRSFVNREGMKFFGGYHVNEYRATGQLTRGNRSELALFRHHKSSDVNTALLLRLAFINKGRFRATLNFRSIFGHNLGYFNSL